MDEATTQQELEPIAAIQERKADHLKICLEEPVGFQEVTNGFEQYRFVHQALPEIDLGEIDLQVKILGKRLSAPLLVSGMTGGTEQAAVVNRNLAAAVQELGLGMGVGSMRIIFSNKAALPSFQVRPYGPDILLLANLGAVQLNYGFGAQQAREAVEAIGADALNLHLNPLQEAVQPEGNTNFARLIPQIDELAGAVPFPIVLKETGCGISAEVAARLVRTRIAGIDVQGGGGTSWSLIESYRAKSERQRLLGRAFADWGIPTAESLVQCRAAAPKTLLIASGGIRNGIEIAKAIALGADAVSVAHPVLEAATQSPAAVVEKLRQLIAELRVAMFCIGVRDLTELRGTARLQQRA